MTNLQEKPFTGPGLCALSACEAVELLKKGEVSPIEMLEAACQRIEEVEPSVNALPTLCHERAKAAANTLKTDEKDHPGWLAGLPIAIKDLSPVAGVRKTNG
jgi:amidase